MDCQGISSARKKQTKDIAWFWDKVRRAGQPLPHFSKLEINFQGRIPNISYQPPLFGSCFQQFSSCIWGQLCYQGGFPGDSVVKNLPANAGGMRVGSLGGEDPLKKRNPFQHSYLENSIDRGTWQGYSPGGWKESDITEHACIPLHHGTTEVNSVFPGVGAGNPGAAHLVHLATITDARLCTCELGWFQAWTSGAALGMLGQRLP